MRITVEGETKDIQTLWMEGNTVKMIDQRRLPHHLQIIELQNHLETAKAIKEMVTRGAGAIGCSAAYGIAQAALEASEKPLKEFQKYMEMAADTLRKTRPTAVNLFHAIDRCLEAVKTGTIPERIEKVYKEAEKIAEENLEASKRIGRLGAELIKNGWGILTHCNAGALAFIDLGTALSPIRHAHKNGKKIHVFVDETRPRCQGARLTAWELQQERIPYSLIVDNAAGHFIRRGEVDMVIVGADRICANGDVANKIGTYEKAVLAKENQIPFYVAAPAMTFDLETSNGEGVEIENRSIEEVTTMWGLDEEGKYKKIMIAGDDTTARNPSFDITPAEYITAFITELGVINPPFKENLQEYLTLENLNTRQPHQKDA